MLSLRGCGGVYRVDPYTGETTKVPYVRKGEYAEINLDLKSWETAIFLWAARNSTWKR